MGSSAPDSDPKTLVVLLFGVKLVRVQITGHCLFRDIVARIQSSDEHDLPAELKTLMKKYKPRNYRYFTPRQLFRIDDINRVPEPQELNDMLPLDGERWGTLRLYDYAKHANPLDGSSLNVAVEEPLPLDQLSNYGDARFRSREVIIFLNKHDIDVFPVRRETPICSGRMGETSQRVWCKLVHEPELNTFKALQSLNCDAHHIATLVVEPFLLSPDQYLITMLDYGADLFLTSVHPSWARARLCGGAIHNIAVQLCEAIAFLHSHHFFHLDIKPENVAFDHTTSRLTILDLGWTMHGAFKKPGVRAAVGTHRYAPPEVCAWYVWEDLDENDPTPSPPSFDPRKADVWGIGNLIGILLESDVQQVDHYEELVDFSQWLAQREPKDRPSAEEALESLREISSPTPQISSESKSAAAFEGGHLSLPRIVSPC